MTTPKDTTLLGLVRHAETVWNRERRIQGQQDSPLTARGRRNARRWGEALADCGWERILASDLGRAVQTAELINAALRVPVLTDEGLREQDWGEWTARTFAQLHRREAERLKILAEAGWGFSAPGGETRFQVLDRSRRTLQAAAGRWPGQRTLVVCHEGVIKCLIYHFRDRRFLPGEKKLLKADHLHLLAAENGLLLLKQVNALDLSWKR